MRLTRRERIAAELATWVLRYVGSRRLKARVMVAIFVQNGWQIPEDMAADAQLSRGPGE